jgi:CSLREA domain-containing protein
MFLRKPRMVLAGSVVAILFALTTLLPFVAQAKSHLTVNTLDDVNDGVCDAASCSLREAIAASEPSAQINFASGLTGTIALTDLTGELEIIKNLEITGPGNDKLTISGSNETRIFFVGNNASFTLQDVTLANGFTAIGGAAIRTDINTSTDLTDVILENNRTTGAGGAIFNEGNMTLKRSIIRNNIATFIGGGIDTFGQMEIIRTTVEGNRATNLGGGIVYEGVSLDIRQSIIQGNQVNNTAFGGGGLAIRSPGATITHTTIQNNSAFNGAGIYNSNTIAVLVQHTTIINPAGNTNCYSTDSDIAPVQDGGHNLQAPGTSCGASIPVANPG